MIERGPIGEERFDAASLLRDAGISPTVQRRRIADVLLSRPQHLSADEVLKLLNRAGEAVSKATVYNTLKLFLRKGLVKEVIVDPERAFYDSNIGPHHHFYNEDTGRLTDFNAQGLRVSGVPRVPDGTVQAGVDVIVRLRNGG